MARRGARPATDEPTRVVGNANEMATESSRQWQEGGAMLTPLRTFLAMEMPRVRRTRATEPRESMRQ